MDVNIATPPRRPEFTPEQLARFFFRLLLDDNDEPTGDWRCKICQRDYRQHVGRGYSNLLAHLRARHPDYEERFRAASVTETGALMAWVSQRSQNRFNWIAWVVESNLPFTFCEHPETRRNTRLTPISHGTLRDDIVRLNGVVEAKVAESLPDKFGIIFDGWSHNSEHYLAIYGSYDEEGVVYTPLLSLAPIINEPDDNHNAQSHMNAIETVLASFGKSLTQCVFLIGDNCSVNKKLARLMDVPLVGCASHRLNLAVKLLTATHEAELGKIQSLMIKLRTLNQAAALRFKTPLRPNLRQDTRWSSTFTMLKRFFELREFLDREDEVIADLLPSAAMVKKLKVLLEQLKNVESVSKKVQSMSATMWEVRTLFDALIDQFPVFKEYLGPNAAIFANPAFESAIVKLQAGHNLNRVEKQAVIGLKGEANGNNDEDDDDGFAERVLKRARVAEQTDRYILVPAVAPTSNVVERLFSQARALIGLDRHSLQPIALESIIFLKINRGLWDVHDVHDMIEQL